MEDGKIKKVASKFGGFKNSSYLCTVRTLVLTTPLSAGSKTLSPLLHLNATSQGWLLFFILFSKDAVEVRIASQSTLDGYSYLSFNSDQRALMPGEKSIVGVCAFLFMDMAVLLTSSFIYSASLPNVTSPRSLFSLLSK